jgi:LPS-assembly protein
VISRAIALSNGTASTHNAVFKFVGVPLFYLPWLRHPVDQTGRESGLLVPVLSNSSIKGFIVGEQVYWVINRSMDMIVGSEYYSKRGWAPNGDFRYKGPGQDHLTARWNALFDRGVEEQIGVRLPTAAAYTPAALIPGPTGMEHVNQGGVDVVALGRKDLTTNTRVAGTVEYLSNYVYRLVFNDNFSQAVSSEVLSDLSVTNNHRGFMPSVSLDRFQTFASSTNGDEARILHLPAVHYDVLTRPLAATPAYWGLSSSLDYLSRSEPHFHARNVGRFDLFPHLSMPFSAGGWSLTPEVAVRDTFYSISQVPDLTGFHGGTPSISHDALNRSDFEASLDLRAPAVERDFDLPAFHRVLRHVIEPELNYRYVAGIGRQARNVLFVDTTDIATNTNELGLSLTQRFYLRPTTPCANTEGVELEGCERPREWASWQLASKFFFDPSFGGAVIPNRRNVFTSTLDLTGIAFLTDPRNFAPVASRMRFEAIDHLRVEWDLDFDPKLGRLSSDNLFAGYSWNRTTVGIGHALLNAVDEAGSSASTIQSQQLQPFLSIGKQTGSGFNLAANAGYDFVQDSLQYAGVQAVYNWNCCGLTFGYRRFELGSIRDETQYLYSFTIANFGSVGDVRRTNSVFRDPTLPPAY